MAYREMDDVLGVEERELAAIRELGRWADRLRIRILAVCAVLGIVPAALGYWFVQEAMFRYAGPGVLLVNVAVGVCIPLALSYALGELIGKRVVAAWMPARVVSLAKAYEIPGERLESTARLVSAL